MQLRMIHLLRLIYPRALALSAVALLTAAISPAFVTPNTRTFTAGQQTKVKGVIVSREGNTMKLRGDDDAIGTIDLTGDTKIDMKHGVFGWSKSKMDVNSLLPGLRVEVEGKGNEQGALVASKVTFDPNSLKASRQIDTRVSPLEARTGSLEGRSSQLESKTGQLESRQGELESTEKQTQQQVGQVKQETDQAKQAADQANQGVGEVNNRVSNLDNYETKYSADVYFKINSSRLSPQAKQDLDKLAQEAKNEKGYVIEVAGYADKTGNAARNQALSEQRADAVVRYLEQQGDIPIHRILSPAGMGTSHEAAPNNTATGRKMNRRVEVKVLVNQGVVASSNTQPNPGTKPPGTPQSPQ